MPNKSKKGIIRTIPKQRQENKLPLKGKEFFDHQHGNSMLIGQTASGKTTVLYNIITISIDKRTKVFIFCSSIYLDDGWQAILKWLEKKKVPHQAYTSMVDENGINILDTLVEMIEAPKEEEEEEKKEEEPEPEQVGLLKGQEGGAIRLELEPDHGQTIQKRRRKRKPRPPKDRVPEYMIVFDDLNKNQLRSSSMINLLKKSRRFAKVIISSQHPNHIYTDNFAQLWNLCLWSGYNKLAMERLYEYIMPRFSFEEFYELYYLLTKKKWSFANINMRERFIQEKFTGAKISLDKKTL